MSAYFTVTVTMAPRPGRQPVGPRGLLSPEAVSLGTEVVGAEVSQMHEASTGQAVWGTRSGDAPVVVTEPKAVAPESAPRPRTPAIGTAVAEKFPYGHPEPRYCDGRDETPRLGFELTPSSLGNINTSPVASLPAAGIWAGYAAGSFFPVEKIDQCSDLPGWVVTRYDARVEALDIAYALKMGTRESAPGLNPKPGFRAAVARSMGFDCPDLRLRDTKLIAEPLWIGEGVLEGAEVSLRLQHPEIRA